MANTVSILSYANTFGDWVVTTNSLAKENNDFAANNYVKPTGTLYLNEPTLGLQVANNAIIAGQLQVTGVGSSAYIQNNLRVDQQVYFTNTSLSLTASGQANIAGPIYATGSGTGLYVANNASIAGTLSVGGLETIGGSLTIGGGTKINNYLNVTGNTNISNTLTVSGTTTISNTINITGDAHITNDITGYNLTLGNKAIVYSLQSNAAINTATLSVTGVSYTNNLQANNSVNTASASVTGTTYTNVLQANSSVNTATISVTGTEYVDTIYANTNITSPKIVVNGLIDANGAAAFFDTVQTTGQLSVGGNFVINGATVYATNTFTLSANSTVGQISYYNVNRGSSGANASIRWNETSKYWDILDVNTGGTYSKIMTANLISDSVTNTSTSTVASSAAANTLNNSIIGVNTALVNANNSMKSYVDANVSNLQGQISSNVVSLQSQISTNVAYISGVDIAQNTFAQAAFNKANTGSGTFNGTIGQAVSNNGVITFSSNNGVVVSGTSNTLYINDPQDLRTTASPTFNSLTLTNALAIPQGGTGATNAADARTALLPTGTTAGYVLTTGGPGNFYWAASGGGGGGVATGTTINSTRLTYTGNGTGLAYTTPTYIPGAAQLRVYIDGVRQFASEYTETSNTIVTFTSSPPTGSAILIEVDGYINNPYYANNITFTAPFGGIVSSANTIQLAIQDLETRKAALASPSFTGIATSVTPSTNTSNTQIATTAFVQNTLNSGNTFTLNAATVTNGVVTTGSYANPSWITSLANTKITGTFAVASITGLATSATTDTTNATNISSGTLNAARLPYSMNQAVATSSSVQFNSIGVGTAASGTGGEIRATNNITAYYSDDRLKTRLGNIENALEKVMTLNGFKYEANETAQALGYTVKPEVGLSAQEVQAVLPEVVVPAPIDEKYLTIHYERVIPLLVEAIKELKAEIDTLKGSK